MDAQLSAPKGLAVSPDGKHVYVTGTVFFLSRDKRLGSLTVIQCVSRTAGTCTTPVSFVLSAQRLAK